VSSSDSSSTWYERERRWWWSEKRGQIRSLKRDDKDKEIIRERKVGKVGT
jgi:hypothetical protein